MKRILPIFSLAALMAACNSNPSTPIGDAKVDVTKTVTISAEDSFVLAEFHSWKTQNEQNELKDAKAFLGKDNQFSEANTTKKNTSAYKTSGSRSVNNNAVYASESSHSAKAKKKGWSKAAKATAIGVGSGAVIGAVVNKRNRVAGAVIGGVLGGGAGYGIGRSMDKKDGRY